MLYYVSVACYIKFVFSWHRGCHWSSACARNVFWQTGFYHCDSFSHTSHVISHLVYKRASVYLCFSCFLFAFVCWVCFGEVGEVCFDCVPINLNSPYICTLRKVGYKNKPFHYQRALLCILHFPIKLCFCILKGKLNRGQCLPTHSSVQASISTSDNP